MSDSKMGELSIIGVIHAVSKRAKELADMSMDDLRLLMATDPLTTLGSSRKEFRGDLFVTDSLGLNLASQILKPCFDLVGH